MWVVVVETDFRFIRAENRLVLVYASNFDLAFVCVVDIDLTLVRGVELDLISVQGSELFWFVFGGRNSLGFSIWIKI